MRVARFKVLEWRRKQQSIPFPIEEELLLQIAGKAEVAQIHDDPGPREALEQCLANLSEKDTRLLNERYHLDNPVTDIAEKLGRTRDAVYVISLPIF